MKKFVALLLLICTLGLTACSKNLDNIPSLELIRQEGEVWAAEKLQGYTPENLQEIWGEPDGMLSGLYGHIWQIGDDLDHVVVYYDEDSKVSDVKYVSVMRAEIIEVSESDVMVKPCEGEWELSSSDKISIGTSEISEDIKSQFEIGRIVRVEYDGLVMETYPAQINAKYGITLEK